MLQLQTFTNNIFKRLTWKTYTNPFKSNRVVWCGGVYTFSSSTKRQRQADLHEFKDSLHGSLNENEHTPP